MLEETANKQTNKQNPGTKSYSTWYHTCLWMCTWAPCNQVNHELLCMPKYSRVKCPTPWLKLGHATGQWSQANQQIYNRMVEQEKNQSAAMVQRNSRPQPDWIIVVGPSESCAQMNASKPQLSDVMFVFLFHFLACKQCTVWQNSVYMQDKNEHKKKSLKTILRNDVRDW